MKIRKDRVIEILEQCRPECGYFTEEEAKETFDIAIKIVNEFWDKTDTNTNQVN